MIIRNATFFPLRLLSESDNGGISIDRRKKNIALIIVCIDKNDHQLY